MAKFNYFDALEALSEIMEKRIQELFTPTRSIIAQSTSKSKPIESKKKEESKTHESAEQIICSLEKILFSDFFPPLERADIAALAHSLGRVIDKASDISCRQASSPLPHGDICKELASIINQNIRLLKKIRKSEGILRADEFRSLVNQCTQAPKDSTREVLIAELSLCFDCLVEIILNNI